MADSDADRSKMFRKGDLSINSFKVTPSKFILGPLANLVEVHTIEINLRYQYMSTYTYFYIHIHVLMVMHVDSVCSYTV